jgi:ketosteroid isomerase-like protein
MKLPRLLLLALCIGSLACQPATEQRETLDEQAVIDTLASLARQFSQAYIEGDVHAMTALYTDDAVLFPGNSEYIRGKDAIARYWTLPEGRRITHHKLIPVEVEVSATMASDFGHYEISGENDGAAWGPVYGKYVVVWKRGADGRWRMHLDMWNSRAEPQE